MSRHAGPELCEHANECPNICPCAPACYCHTFGQTCAGTGPRTQDWGVAHQNAAAAMWCREAARAIGACDTSWADHTPRWWTQTEARFRDSMRKFGRDPDAAVRTVDKIARGEWTVVTTIEPGLTVIRDGAGKLLALTVKHDATDTIAYARQKCPHGKLTITKRVTRHTRIGRPRKPAALT